MINYKKKIIRSIYILVLVLTAALFLAPILWMVSTSFKTSEDVYIMPPQWIPTPATIINYLNVFVRIPFWTYIKNTFAIAFIPVIGELITVPLVTYSITKIEWKGAKFIFGLVLVTMMIPWQVTQIPLFTTWSKLGLVNTYTPLVLPAFFGGSYYIYLMRQFMVGIPNSFIESARIDGASEFKIIKTIMMPLCKPILTTIALLVFINGWNDLQGPLMYLQQSDKYTLSVGLNSLMNDVTVKRQSEFLMAASFLFSIPLVVLFGIFQKQFISGMSEGGVKG